MKKELSARLKRAGYTVTRIEPATKVPTVVDHDDDGAPIIKDQARAPLVMVEGHGIRSNVWEDDDAAFDALLGKSDDDLCRLSVEVPYVPVDGDEGPADEAE